MTLDGVVILDPSTATRSPSSVVLNPSVVALNEVKSLRTSSVKDLDLEGVTTYDDVVLTSTPHI